MKLVLASKNPHKLEELQAILDGLGVEVLLESDAGVDVEVEETGATFEENARIKAEAVMPAGCPRWPTTRGFAWTPSMGRRGCSPPGTAGRA